MPSSQQINEMVKYYQNLLIMQYHERLNAKKDIEIKSKNATGDFLLLDMWKYFDVDTAEGAQLDLIGKIVGVERKVDGFDFNIKMYSYNDTELLMFGAEDRGMSDVDHINEIIWRDIDTASRSIYAMTDDQYRQLIKMKILINNSSSTCKEFDDTFYRIFGTSVICINNHDLSITFNVKLDAQLVFRIAVFLGILPIPLAVSYDINYLNE